MSVELFRACAQVTMLYRDAPMSSGQKFVLRELCDFASPDGVAWPKQEALMVRTCLKRPAIIANTDALEGAGWLKRRRSTQLEYVLNTEAIMSNAPPMYAPQRSEIERSNVRKSNIECSEIERSNVRKSNIECSEIECLPIKRTDTEQTEEQTLNRASAKQPMIPLPQRLCLQLSAALKINAQPTTAVSSTHPGMLALVKAIPVEWEDTALAMVAEVVRELVGNGKAGPGLYAYALAVLKTRMEREVAKSQAASPDHVNSGCPHDQIVALWGEVLPGCRQPVKWGGERARNLADRWGEDVDRQSLDWWEKFFRYLGESDFLMGRTRHRFSMGLDWIVKDDIFLKALEGWYENGDDNA